uniref:Uncharacterized protein n=1 Tax=Amphimedon queenslandica TaxID=400682 RepID=A0A1X7U682_AMPQE
MTPDVVKRRFEASGISVAIDDNKIHCLKDGQVAAVARTDISEKTSALFRPVDINEDTKDPFADIIEGHEELDTNEIAVDNSEIEIVTPASKRKSNYNESKRPRNSSLELTSSNY